MTRPTVFGSTASSLLAGGEAGAEAILPLEPFYSRLEKVLDRKMETIETKNYVYVNCYLDGEEIAQKTYTKVDGKMVEERKKRR